MTNKYKFVLIDDVKVNNFITGMIIKKVYPDIDVVSFTDAQSGLDFVKENGGNKSDGTKLLVLLDIYMPVMNGWDFLREYGFCGDEVHAQVKIWLLSSSISKADMNRSKEYAAVLGYAIKPLTEESFREMMKNEIT